MEACVASQLGFNQIDYFYPTLTARPVNPRSQKIKPYFPGYLFVKLEAGTADSSVIKWMPGAVGLVRFDNQPAAVPDRIIEAIRQHVQKLDGKESPIARFRQGDAVQVSEGVLAGMKGIFDLSLPGSQRTRVMLKILGEHYTRVVLPAGFLEPIRQP
jgi:transcription antitermination factor NusG